MYTLYAKVDKCRLISSNSTNSVPNLNEIPVSNRTFGLALISLLYTYVNMGVRRGTGQGVVSNTSTPARYV